MFVQECMLLYNHVNECMTSVFTYIDGNFHFVFQVFLDIESVAVAVCFYVFSSQILKFVVQLCRNIKGKTLMSVVRALNL